MIRDTEVDAGMLSVTPFDGEALATPSVLSDREEVMADGSEISVPLCKSSLSDNDAVDDDNNNLAIAGQEHSLAKEECRQRVGFTINMSVNLGSLSLHFDAYDTSQGFSVWTEDVLGFATNWFFVLPYVHSLKLDGVTKLRKMAIKVGHGLAICWDDRVIQHWLNVHVPFQ
jgi:hypothetical protein